MADRKKGASLHGGKYRPEQFLIPGQDQNGNSNRIGCRVTPLLDRAIDLLINSKRFPLRTKGDFLRFAADRTVRELSEMEPVLGSVEAQVDAMMTVLAVEQHNHSFLTLFNTMTVQVGMHIQAQAIGEARRLISVLHSQIMEMEEGYWRDRYLKELDTKFGYLLNGAGAGLGQHEDRGEDTGGIDEDE